ncbi:MAG: NAD-dependent protein deacylase [Candidatus Heimdallarchaeota archaeon]|nr:NAD-dependent protein deacylase [Candidatus Heimdallarchaeota archaeon]
MSFDEVFTEFDFGKNIVVVVGAGIGVGSGLKTFRGPGGMYENKRAEELASPYGFEQDPEMVWAWYKERMERMFAAEPNAAHHSIVRLEREGILSMLITQNVDGLHRRAGQKKLIEIHGTVLKTHCFRNCGRTGEMTAPPEIIPVMCECGSYQRPSVVWFGETLNYDDLHKVDTLLRQATAVFSIGTSGYVYPVSQFPAIAQHHGAIHVDFNIEPSPLSHSADLFVMGPAEETVPVFVDSLLDHLKKST